MQLPTIRVFWKSDLPDGFGFKAHGELAEHIWVLIEKYLPVAIADIRENPEAKDELLDQLAWYAANRDHLSEEDQFVYGAIMAAAIVALKKTGFIMSDEFNGIVYAAAIASAPGTSRRREVQS